MVVNNIWSSWGEERIRGFFSRFGKIVKVRLDRTVRKAYIAFSTAEALQYLRNQRYLSIDGLRFLTSPGNDGTCSIAVVDS